MQIQTKYIQRKQAWKFLGSRFLGYTYNTDKYIHHSYTNFYKYIQKYIQNKSVTMCIYVYLCACICMYIPLCIYVYVLLCYYVYLCACICPSRISASVELNKASCLSVCMYLHVYACIMSVWLYFMHPKTWSDVHVVCACICMYLHVSTDCHCSQWFYVCNWATLRLIEHHGLSASGAVIEEGLNQGTLACIYWHEIRRYMQILTWYQQIHAIQTHTYIGQPAKIDLSWLGPEHLGNVFLPGILTGISGGNAYWQIHAHTYNTCLYIHIVTK